MSLGRLSAMRGAFEVYDHLNALEALDLSGDEGVDIGSALETFSFSKADILSGGGGKSAIAASLCSFFYRRGWCERAFNLNYTVSHREMSVQTHRIDCVSGRVVLEVEWNNKDTFFDRDLTAMRMLYAQGVIDCGVIITRSSSLQKLFKLMVEHEGLSKDKFVSSTTHMDKLIPRVISGGAGDCPVLCIGITRASFAEDVPLTDELIYWNMVQTDGIK